MSATPESVAPASPAEIAVTESQVPSAPLPGATILGYPRIGRDRELKRAVESFWKGNLSADELKEKLASLKEELFGLRFQHATGQLDNPMRIKDVKKTIARIKTIQREQANA